MKFVKENLTVVICAAVALLLVVAAFVWPMPGKVDVLRKKMVQRFAVRQDIKTKMQTSLVLPGLTEIKGIPSQAYIDAKKKAIDTIENQKKSVEDLGKTFNSEGRINAAKVPLLPVPGTAGVPEPGFLPKIRNDASALKYKADYNSQFRLWTGLLTQGSPADVETDFATPPDATVLKNQWDDKIKARSATPGMIAATVADAAAFNDHQKQAVMNKAADLRMYVERFAFQVRSWALLDSPPNDQEIFESLVDSWVQSDVVKAIAATNLIGNPNATDHKNISRSAVKRLTRIVVGNNARTRYLGQTVGNMGGSPTSIAASGDPGPLFLTSANALTNSMGPAVLPGVLVNPGGGGAAPAADAASPPNTTDYTLGMSGRSAGADYDIVMVNILIDIDPARLNAFVDQLCRQNMGYTVSNIQWKMIDPLDRASYGYLYGDGQVIEAEIIVEGLFFRSWTLPLMPDSTRSALSLPPGKP